MDNYKKEFIEFLIKTNALQFGKFTTKSGRLTPYYINIGECNNTNKLRELSRYYAKTLSCPEFNYGHSIDNIFGPTYKGISLSISTALYFSWNYGIEVSYTFNRKELKSHGDKGDLLGFNYSNWVDYNPCRVIIVDDVITSGDSIKGAINIIKKSGKAIPIGLVVAVDRMEKTTDGMSALTEVEENYGIKAIPIINFLNIIEFLETAEAGVKIINSNPNILEDMKAYWDTYGILI